MKAISAIINFFLFWNKISVKYDRIKKDDEKRKKSQRMGITSIIYSVVCIAGLIIAIIMFL